MLAAAVDPGEGLLVQQADQAVARGHLAHELHGQLVMVGGDIGAGEDRGQLVLRGGDLVVLGLGQDAQLPQLLVQIVHELGHARLQRAEVVILQLLALGRARAEQRPAGEDQVGPLVKVGLVHQEVLLLRAHGGGDRVYVGLAEQAQDAQGLVVNQAHRAQQRGLLVQRLAGIGAEGGGDAQRVVLDEGVGGRVPGRVAAGLEGGAQAAAGEGRRVRFALDQLLAGKLHDDLVAVGGDEGLVLLGGDAGHRLEPVGVVGRALFNRPVLHGVGHDVGDLAGERTVLRKGLLEFLIGRVGQALPHHVIVEYHRTEYVGRIERFH